MYLQKNIIYFDFFVTIVTLVYENNSKAQLFLYYNLFISLFTSLIIFFDKQYNDILQRDIENDLNKKRLFSNLYIVMNHLHCFISSLFIIQISQTYYPIAIIVSLNLTNLYSMIAILIEIRSIQDEMQYLKKIYFLIELSIISIITSVMFNLTNDLSILNECIGFFCMYVLSLFIHNFTLLQFVQIYGSYITYKFIKIEDERMINVVINYIH